MGNMAQAIAEGWETIAMQPVLSGSGMGIDLYVEIQGLLSYDGIIRNVPVEWLLPTKVTATVIHEIERSFELAHTALAAQRFPHRPGKSFYERDLVRGNLEVLYLAGSAWDATTPMSSARLALDSAVSLPYGCTGRSLYNAGKVAVGLVQRTFEEAVDWIMSSGRVFPPAIGEGTEKPQLNNLADWIPIEERNFAEPGDVPSVVPSASYQAITTFIEVERGPATNRLGRLLFGDAAWGLPGDAWRCRWSEPDMGRHLEDRGFPVPLLRGYLQFGTHTPPVYDITEHSNLWHDVKVEVINRTDWEFGHLRRDDFYPDSGSDESGEGQGSSVDP